MKEKINIRKTILTVIGFNIAQIVIIIGFVIFNYGLRGHVSSEISVQENLIFYGLVLMLIVSSFFSVKNMYAMSFISTDRGTMKSTLDQLESLNRTLRSQRHDFINHLQVVYSLMELEEYPEARDYIEKVYNDIQRVSRALKTSNPAVNALLQAKFISCEKKNIEMKLNITTELNNLTIPSWELCRVLGNIIDNAVYALQGGTENRIIEITIFEDIKNFGFKIANNGPRIPDSIIGRIFDAGFSTKGEEGEGMGLAITREIINSYGGNIEVESDDGITAFKGYIPKQ